MSADGANQVVLVMNSGSSSLKYQLVEPDSGASRAGGTIEQIGEQSSPVADHEAALRRAFDELAEAGIDLKTVGLVAVGHRVVHGGKRFHRPTVLDDAVVAQIAELSELAPLHNPPAVQGIEVARKLLPDTPQVAVFDTAFFHDLPPRPPPTRSIGSWPSSGRSAGTDFTARRTGTSASRPPPFWAGRRRP